MSSRGSNPRRRPRSEVDDGRSDDPSSGSIRNSRSASYRSSASKRPRLDTEERDVEGQGVKVEQVDEQDVEYEEEGELEEVEEEEGEEDETGEEEDEEEEGEGEEDKEGVEEEVEEDVEEDQDMEYKEDEQEGSEIYLGDDGNSRASIPIPISPEAEAMGNDDTQTVGPQSAISQNDEPNEFDQERSDQETPEGNQGDDGKDPEYIPTKSTGSEISNKSNTRVATTELAVSQSDEQRGQPQQGSDHDPTKSQDDDAEESGNTEHDTEDYVPSKSTGSRVSNKSVNQITTTEPAVSQHSLQDEVVLEGGDQEDLEGSQDNEVEESGSSEDDADEYIASKSTGSEATNSNNIQAGTTERVPSQNGLRDGVAQEAFKPGAIVRIRVTDFVTYTSAEFFPGPKLNMVIGPNGTGKSTLVCAICLGLGWGPQHLGRAKDTGEFVKHGCREATIEIELAGGPGSRRNPVVSRTIKRDGNKSTFAINGKQASRSQVLKLAQSFAIQIDNLCQFLPQDKVSEFAALTPIELLNSTQRAAAGEEMIQWHDNLKRLRAEQKKLQTDNQGDRDLLTNLEDRQEMQRADVERMRQRAQIKRNIELLNMIRPVLQFKAGHAKYNDMKKEVKRIETELERLKAELEPALRSVNAKQQYCLQTDEVIKYKAHQLDEAERAAGKAGKMIERHEQAMKEFDSQIDAEKKSGQGYRQEANKIQQAINKLTRQLNDEPVELDVDWYNQNIREKRREVREIEEKANQIKADRRPLFESLQEKNDQVKQAERQLQNLDSATGQQENKLKRISADSLRAYHWIQDNQNQFEKEVFGPPMITCSVKDPKYADAVEAVLQRTDLLAFTTQTRNDFKKLQKALCVDQRLSDIAIRTCSDPLASQRRLISDDEMRAHGFECLAIDCLSGPQVVISMLCNETRLDKTPIRQGGISEAELNRLKASRIDSWVAGKGIYLITRRKEYGPSATNTRRVYVKPAKVWTSQPVDASERQQLAQRVRALKGEMQEVQEQMDGEKTKLQQLGDAHMQLKQELSELEREKADKQTALTNYRAIPERIRQQEVKQRDNQRIFEEMRTRVGNLRSEQDQASIRKAEAAIEYANAVEKFQKLHEEVIKLKVRHLEGLSDLEVLKARNIEHRQTLEAKHEEMKVANQEIRDMSKSLKKMQEETRKVADLTREYPDLAELLHKVKDQTLDQLEADIDSEKARLELTHGGNSNLIKEFEERSRQIDKLRDKLSDFQKKLDDYNHAINEIRGRWEPKLDSIIKKISDAFSDSFARIGCAGQVTLDKAEEPGPNGEPGDSDFDQWSIQIHVKFREHENLSLLDSHRQSGGERAVSTIFYLMALQSLSASPFRVVDEINQGMDPRNERMVHGRLVDIACAPSESGGGGQYFLITPKLLSGLSYKPGMRVLCIYSGEHMPDDHNLIDFKGAIATRKAVTAAAAAAAGTRKGIRAAASNGSVSVHG